MIVQPSDAVVVFLEMQPRIVQASATVAPERLLDAVRTLRSCAEGLGIPLLASIVPMSPGSEGLVDELRGVEVHVRTTVGVFDDEPLSRRIRSFGRGTIVFAGVSSEIAVAHAALGARREGFEAVLPTDCCGGLSDRTEATALAVAAAAGCRITNVSTLLTGMISDMTSDRGRLVMSELGRHWGWS